MTDVGERYPSLTKKHLADARLYATREDMIANLSIAPGGLVTEVGVALGDFSDFLITQLRPRLFTAIDVFSMHEYPVHWGRTSEELFGGRTHRQFYEDRFRNRDVKIVESLSHEALPRLGDGSQDLIYIDAEHIYEGVKRDAALSVPKVKSDGYLVFNDYIMYDHFLSVPYGVVQAVNELLAEGEWKVVGFALQRSMFCDIALRR